MRKSESIQSVAGKVIYRGGVLLLAFLFASCENFFNGAELRREIEEQIAHANAPKTTIRVGLGSADYGSVYPSDFTGAAGDSFTIKFTKKSGIVFKEWTCFDSIGSASDAVIFSNGTSVEDKGNGTEIITVTATIKEVRDGIEIRPKCYNPIESVKPEFTVLRIARTEEDARNGTNLISLEEFEFYAKKANYGNDSTIVNDNVANHHVKSVWFYFEADDSGGGVESLEVREKLIRSTNGEAIGVSTVFKTPYHNNGGLSSFSGAFEYNFKNASDGVVNLSFVTIDYSGNETSSEEAFSKKIDLVKDTTVDLKSTICNDSIVFLEPNQSTVHYDFVVQPFSSNNYNVYATDIDGNEYFEGWGARFASPDQYRYSYKGHFARLIRIETGYAEDSLSPLPDSSIVYCEGETYHQFFRDTYMDEYFYRDDFYRISFDCDPYRDLYIRTVIADEAENESYWSYRVPKAIDVISCEYETVNVERDLRYDTYEQELLETDTVESPVLKVRLSSTPINKNTNILVFAARVDGDGKIDKNFYEPKGNLPFGYIIEKGFVVTNTSSATVNKCFAHRNWDVVSRSGNVETYGIVDSDSIVLTDGWASGGDSALWLLEDGVYNIYCISFDKSYTNAGSGFLSCTGKPITVYKGVEKPQSTAPSSADLPSDFTVTLESAGKNSGKQIAHVKYPDGFTPNPNLTYIVNYSHPATGSYSKLDENSGSMDFEIPTHYCTYSFKIIAYNANGQKVETSAKQVTVDYDNISPELVYFYSPLLVTPNGAVFTGFDASDDKSGVLKKDGKISVKYLYTSTNFINDDEIDINWNSNAILTAFCEAGGNLELPYDGTRGSHLYLQVSDENGNTLEKGFEVPFALIEQPQVSWTSSKINVAWQSPYSSSTNEGSNEGYNVTVHYLSGNTWTLSHGPTDVLITKTEKNRSWAVTPTGAETNSFIKIQVWGRPNCLKTAYVYLPYLKTPSSYVPKLADCSVGIRGLSVLSDKPVLVHTFHAGFNLGNDVDDWLYNGIETGVVQQTDSFTYTNDNLSGVPSGRYYTTIVHFANGTKAMTEVKRMN